MKKLPIIVGLSVLVMVFTVSPIVSFGAGSGQKVPFAKEHVLLLAMHADLMEAIEEVFAYQLLNDAKEKQEFFKKMKDFDKLAGQLKSVVKDKPTMAALKMWIEEKNGIVKAAEDMFKKFEANKKPDMAAVKAFEAKVDAMTEKCDALEKDLTARAEKAGVLKDELAETGWHVHRLHGDAMEAIEEAMAYPLLGDAAEKKDFYRKLKDFDDIAKHLASDPDHLKGDKAKLELLKKVVEARVKLQKAAETMFKDYETKKAAAAGDVMKFEREVDEFTATFDKLSESLLKGIAK